MGDKRRDSGEYYPGGKVIPRQPVTPGGGADANAVHYYAETKTEAEKTQARQNIGAAAAGDIPNLDQTVTQTSSNGVKSSGIWTWVKSLLPSWLTADSEEPRGKTDFDVMGDIEVVPSGDPVEADFPSIKWYVTESRLGDFTLEWNASDGVWSGWSEGRSATIMLEDGVFQFYSVFGPAYVGGYPQAPTQYETSYSETFVLSVKKSASGKVGSIARTSATSGVAKLGADGVLTVASKSSDVGEDADYRDPTDNVCRAESSKFVATGAPHGFNDEPIYDPSVGILWTDDAGGVWCAIQPITDVNFTFYAYGGGAEGQFTATRQRVATKGETFVTPSYVDDVAKTYVVTDAVDGGVSVKINGETVTMFADLLAVCKTGRAVLYGQATTVETGYAFYTAASVTDSVIQYQVSGMLYDKSNVRYGMYVRRIKIVPRANGGLLVDDSGLEGPFAKKSETYAKGKQDDGSPVDQELHDFFTNSNSLLDETIAAKLPYPLHFVTTGGALKDRALNVTNLESVTVPDDFTDLLIRASVASSLPVTMPTAITTKYGDTFPDAEGEYLITITKTGAAEAYVRVIKLEVANA